MVEGYAELREVKDTTPRGLRHLCSLADLDIAVRQLPPKEYQAVLLHGLLGHTVRAAETLLGISRSTLMQRYLRGLEILTTTINEGGGLP